MISLDSDCLTMRQVYRNGAGMHSGAVSLLEASQMAKSKKQKGKGSKGGKKGY